MSGFSSLLNQFKQTTQQRAAAAPSPSPSSSGGAVRGGRHGPFAAAPPPAAHADSRRNKRPRHPDDDDGGDSRMNSRRRRHHHQRCHRHPATPVRRVYVACPAFVETGGPEALHQLCHAINSGGYSCGESGDDENGDVGNDAERRDEFGRAIASSGGGGGKGGGGEDGKNENAVRAYMLYLRERGNGGVERVTSSRARSVEYNRYDAPPVPGPLGCVDREWSHRDGGGNDDEDEEYSSELIVWPECWTHLIDSLQPDDDYGGGRRMRKRYQVAIWWLSVNNNKGRFLPRQFALRKDVLHLVQSAYARDYVSSKLRNGDGDGGGKGGVKVKRGGEDGDDVDGEWNVLTMTEFIPHSSPNFSPRAKPTQQATTTQQDSSHNDRDLDVVYNPAKGIHYTDEIIRRACGKKAKTDHDGSVAGGGIKFSPIGKGAGGRERLAGEEVVALLKRSKVYIDFGPHPGMDRLPREAALAGCVVVTNCEGAANFEEDLPLPSEFKFRKFEVDKIYIMLKECCREHATYARKMEPYRNWIRGQEKQMKACVDRFVDRVVARRIAKQVK